MDITFSHKIEDGKNMSDKAMMLVPATSGDQCAFPGSAMYKDGLYTEVENDESSSMYPKRPPWIVRGI